jgi:hypothetical protein
LFGVLPVIGEVVIVITPPRRKMPPAPSTSVTFAVAAGAARPLADAVETSLSSLP